MDPAVLLEKLFGFFGDRLAKRLNVK